MAYDERCEALAWHFLGDIATRELVKRLAQHIQDEVENWIEGEDDPAHDDIGQ